MGAAEARLRQTLGVRLRAARLARKLTQRTLADRAGLDLKHYGAIERGARNVMLATLARLAGALGVEAWELLRPEDQSVVGPPEVDRIRHLLLSANERQRRAVLGLLESFATYRPGRPRR